MSNTMTLTLKSEGDFWYLYSECRMSDIMSTTEMIRHIKKNLGDYGYDFVKQICERKNLPVNLVW